MRKTVFLLAAAAALAVPLVAPAAAASADTQLADITCNDIDFNPQNRHHVYLTTDTPSFVMDLPEHPIDFYCYAWDGSVPAAYTVSYAWVSPSGVVTEPDPLSGVLSYGHGFSYNVHQTGPSYGYFYQATFTALP
ncbi:hypothetical protein ACFO3J_30045 [Streptomyces polygonati]|uniref:Uncharacterized protein n=1 Tax=Streptomyces polygonati TaxID=1617087 RepID=A0ABV8HXV2_9ACTN